MSRTITIDPVTRIEGHARVVLDMNEDGNIQGGGIIVNELRGFERILVGMEADRMPQITARICGVCPSAHHLAAVKALDAAAGVDPPPAAKLLRELLYMGHFIHSHTLSLFVLTGPDLLFGIDGDPAAQNIVGMAAAQPEITKMALRLRTLGQKINEEVGGRGIHPVTALVGGMSYRMDEGRRAKLRALSNECLELVQKLAPVAKQLLVTQLEANPHLVTDFVVPAWNMGVVADGKVNFYDGPVRVTDDTGQQQIEFTAPDYNKYIVERALDWSYMKQVFFNFGGKEHLYRVGTLARINVADGMETPLAQAELETFRAAYGRTSHVTVMQIYARLIELIYACEKAKAIIEDPAIMGETRVPVKFSGGSGVGYVEAPRGTLYHDYTVDDRGIVRAANLVVATQQNYVAINTSILQAARRAVEKGTDDAVLNAIEYTIRCYDPCLSCATHAVGQMDIEIELRQGNSLIRSYSRGRN